MVFGSSSLQTYTNSEFVIRFIFYLKVIFNKALHTSDPFWILLEKWLSFLVVQEGGYYSVAPPGTNHLD